jgi:MerR family transcriptional regulator, light-induced transcriptional regulator
MKLYQIADLEQLTGIKAHTIRIWEKRYNLIEPIRTSTNIRRYSDDHLRKLLNVTTLLSSGMKISRIAELKDKEIDSLVKETHHHNERDAIVTAFINELTDSMVRLDEQAFERSFASVTNRFGLFDGMINVFYPLLVKIGVLWVANNISPYQEHFASSIIRRKIMSATDGLPIPKKRKKFLLFLPQDEYHEITLLFANYMIRAAGYETIYLGQNVPFDNVAAIVKIKKPDFLLTFFVSGKIDTNSDYFKKYVSIKGPQILVSGNPLLVGELNSRKNLNVLKTPQDLSLFL